MLRNIHFSKRLVLLALLLLSANLTAQQATLEDRPVLFPEPLSPRIANYDINVRLDTEKRLLHGNQTLRWVNKTSDTINEMQFHMYQNAFRNSKSTFMQESGGVSRGNRIDKEGWGFIEINSLKLPSGEELLKSMKYIQPDDGNEHDKTVLSVELTRPLSPGETLELNVEFTAKLPSPPFARTGAKEEYFFVGQWFPKVGVYENGAWNTHQFHANSEFFADYGNYDVWINVPEDHILGATGQQVELKNNGDGTATHHYHAEDVHDFAWTSSPEFVEVTGKTQDVDIRILLQPDHAYQADRHMDAAKVAVEYFQNWYGDYPYPNLTVVDPRRGAGGSGGMEYPTLITAGTMYGLPEGLRAVEMVTIHEFGHNYFYHLVASNEFEEPWLDEGITSYAEMEIIDDHYPKPGSGVDLFGIKMNDSQVQRIQYVMTPDLDPIVKAAWEFYDGGYGVNSYARPSVVLTTLRNYLGMEKMKDLMRTYVDRWKFKHPKTQDFIDVANDVSSENLDWYFDQALFTNYILDYSVDRVNTRRIGDDSGFDFDFDVEEELSSDSVSIEPVTNADSVEAEKEISIDSDSANSDEKKSQLYYSEIGIRRLGQFTFPVELEVIFDNGDTLREKWDGKDLWKKFKYTKPAKLVYATVDPDQKIPLDVNYTNNSKSIETHKIGINKLAIRFLFWTQMLFDQPEFLNLFSGFNIGF